MDINDILNTETTADSINSLINDINNSPVVDVPMIDGGLLQGIIDGGSLLDEDSKEEKEIVEDEEKEQDIEEDTDGTVDGEKPAKKKQNKTTEVKETDSEEVQKLKASFAEELEKKETELKKKDEEIKKLKFDGEKKQKQVEDKQEYIDKLKADITLYTEVDDSFDRDDQEAEALDVGYKQLQMTVPLENLRMPAQIVEVLNSEVGGENDRTLADKINALSIAAKYSIGINSGIIKDLIRAVEDQEGNIELTPGEYAKAILQQIDQKFTENQYSQIVVQLADGGIKKTVNKLERYYIPRDEISSGLDSLPMEWVNGEKTQIVRTLKRRKDTKDYKMILFSVAKTLKKDETKQTISEIVSVLEKNPMFSIENVLAKKKKGLLEEIRKAQRERQEIEKVKKTETEKDRKIRELEEKLKERESPAPIKQTADSEGSMQSTRGSIASKAGYPLQGIVDF